MRYRTTGIVQSAHEGIDVTNLQAPVSPLTPTTTPRARRGDAAVLARYIQDLTHVGAADARPAA